MNTDALRGISAICHALGLGRCYLPDIFRRYFMKKILITGALLSALAAPLCSANADSIQMLPPTPLGSTTICPSGMQQVLSYSGTPGGGPQAGINCVPITTDANGDMTASGFVQMGNTAAVCSAPLAGAIRFNPATLDFEGCNGTSWLGFNAATVPSGTICGLQTNGSNFGPLCQGYSPYNGSCPPGYSANIWGVDFGNGRFAFCVKD